MLSMYVGACDWRKFVIQWSHRLIEQTQERTKMPQAIVRVSLAVVFMLVATIGSPAADEPGEWKAGVASAVITPKVPMLMAGYAARKEPSEGTEQELYAKVLAIEDHAGRKAVFITLDLIGVSARLRETVTQQIERHFAVKSEAVVMNASHTHCGPAYTGSEAEDYFQFLAKTLVDLSGSAIKAMQPAALNYSVARCGFAMNRRTPTATGYKNHPNPEGVVDHSVPVISVRDGNGKLKAVMFGYACHIRRWDFASGWETMPDMLSSILNRIIRVSRPISLWAAVEIKIRTRAMS
jgi:neutral ceramidase